MRWRALLYGGLLQLLAVSVGVADDGLADGDGVELVRRHCTVCHSAALVAQNRANREGWLAIIRWMQETQNLWPLGDDEAAILDYLAAAYPPRDGGRRAPLPAHLMPPHR